MRLGTGEALIQNCMISPSRKIPETSELLSHPHKKYIVAIPPEYWLLAENINIWPAFSSDSSIIN
jgi:hypothetical protein